MTGTDDIYERVNPKLRAFFAAHVGARNEDLIDDLTAITWCSYIEGRHRIADPTKHRGYIFGIAYKVLARARVERWRDRVKVDGAASQILAEQDQPAHGTQYVPIPAADRAREIALAEHQLDMARVREKFSAG